MNLMLDKCCLILSALLRVPPLATFDPECETCDGRAENTPASSVGELALVLRFAVDTPYLVALGPGCELCDGCAENMPVPSMGECGNAVLSKFTYE